MKLNLSLCDGQVLNCKYGYSWPLNLYYDGYVKIVVKKTKKNKIKIDHIWFKEKPNET